MIRAVVVGDKAVAAALKRDAKTVAKETKGAVRKACDGFADDARMAVPVDTGGLRGSIEVSMAGNGLSGTVKATGSGRNYAAYVEYGTRRHGRAQPFMRTNFKKWWTFLHGEMQRIVRSRM